MLFWVIMSLIILECKFILKNHSCKTIKSIHMTYLQLWSIKNEPYEPSTYLRKEVKLFLLVSISACCCFLILANTFRSVLPIQVCRDLRGIKVLGWDLLHTSEFLACFLTCLHYLTDYSNRRLLSSLNSHHPLYNPEKKLQSWLNPTLSLTAIPVVGVKQTTMHHSLTFKSQW